jgi:hypothetical protein
MTQLKRNDRIKLYNMGNSKFEGRNCTDDVILDAEKDYFIYMQNVNFKNGNLIEGRYLGNLEEGSPILDSQCKNVDYDENNFLLNGEIIRTARMVAVNNKTNVIVIIAKN